LFFFLTDSVFLLHIVSNVDVNSEVGTMCVVGGIYTVIRTKAAVTVDELGEQYCLIGPLNESCVRTEVEILEPNNDALVGAIQHMREFGIKVQMSQCTLFSAIHAATSMVRSHFR